MKMMRVLLATALATFAATQAQAADADLTAKLNAKVSAMSETQQAALLLLLDQLEASPAAAATPAEAPAETAESALKASLEEFKAMVANKSLDLEKFFTRLSEDFTHPVVGDKAGAIAFIKNLNQTGVIDDAVAKVEFFIDDAEYDVDGDEVEIYPIDVDSPFGSVTLGLYGKNENGVWRITEISGL